MNMEKIITIDGVQYRCTPVEEEQEEEKRISGYYIAADATISRSVDVPDTPHNRNIFATEKLAKRALAMARISQKMANDKRFGSVVTDAKWKDLDVAKWIIKRNKTISLRWDNDDDYDYYLAFYEREQARLFLKENEDLVRQYYML